MTSPRRDPYLWIHLSGLATVPLWLDICFTGLAVGDPTVPPWLELTTLGAVGTIPILWMQLRRPFYIFSIPGLAIRPDQLQLRRRRLLTMQRTWVTRLGVVASAIALFCALYWLYQSAPIATDLPWLAGKSRAMGWLVCAIAFLFANLFTQVPATVVPLLLTPSGRLEKTPPQASDAILSQFTVLGVRVNAALLDRILPSIGDDEDAGEHAQTPSPSPSESEASPSEMGQAVAVASEEDVTTVESVSDNGEPDFSDLSDVATVSVGEGAIAVDNASAVDAEVDAESAIATTVPTEDDISKAETADTEASDPVASAPSATALEANSPVPETDIQHHHTDAPLETSSVKSVDVPSAASTTSVSPAEAMTEPTRLAPDADTLSISSGDRLSVSADDDVETVASLNEVIVDEHRQ